MKQYTPSVLRHSLRVRTFPNFHPKNHSHIRCLKSYYRWFAPPYIVRIFQTGWNSGMPAECRAWNSEPVALPARCCETLRNRVLKAENLVAAVGLEPTTYGL